MTTAITVEHQAPLETWEIVANHIAYFNPSYDFLASYVPAEYRNTLAERLYPTNTAYENRSTYLAATVDGGKVRITLERFT